MYVQHAMYNTFKVHVCYISPCSRADNGCPMQYQAYMHMYDWPWVVNPSEVLKTVIHHEIIISVSHGAILDCGLIYCPTVRIEVLFTTLEADAIVTSCW